MERPVRLVMAVNNLRFFISHRLPLAVAAREDGFEVHVATPTGDGLERLTRAGLIHHHIPFERSVAPIGKEFKAFWELMRLYRRLRPDVVHHVTIKPVAYGGLAGWLAGKPGQVSAITGLGFLYMGDEPWKRVAQWGLARYLQVVLNRSRSLVVFQNPDDQSVYFDSGVIKPEIAVLIRGAGVDTSVFGKTPEPNGLPTVLLPARMLWNKGVGDFVKAAEIVNRNGKIADFVLVGDYDHNPSAVPRETLEAWDRSGVVKWLGYRQDMPDLVKNTHIVCLPVHYREGLPKSLIEAASCGRPIITTDVPGCREVVCDGENGLLVPPMNAPALADAVLRLVANPDLRRSMGDKGRMMVEERFSLDHVIKETLAVYRRLIR